MNLSRLIPGLILAFGLGAVASGLAVQWRMSTRLEEAVADVTRLRSEIRTQDTADRRTHALNDTIARLERELSEVQAELRRVEEEAARPVELSFFVDEMAELTGTMEPLPGEPGEDAPREGRDRWDNLTPEEREAMMERRREFMADFRERINALLADRLQQATDAYEQERLIALQEHFDYISELRQQMREAGTEEEREQLGELLRWSGEQVAGIMREQQNHLLRGVAQEYGITDPGQQAAFVNRMQQVRQDPFFSGGMMPGGGFRGWGGMGGFSGAGRGSRGGGPR